MTFDARTFRDTLSLFVTGVTVITTKGDDGAGVGVTANSFNSVSMTPPLILWSLARSSRSLDAFLSSTHFCVHILREDQEGISQRFATSGANKFSGLNIETGHGDVPLLPECAARLECRTYAKHDGGDHIIFLGEVIRLNADHDARPLLYHGGRYAVLSDKLEM